MIISLGIVGTSVISEQLISSISSNFKLHSIVSRSFDKGLYFQQQYGFIHHYQTVEELASSDVEAVYIASPNALHFQQALILLSAGKHVLLEKPFTLTVEECKRLFETAEENKLTLMEAMKTTLLPNFLFFKQYQEEYIDSVEISFCKRSSRYDELLQGKKTNIFSPLMGGGSLMDLGVYGIWVAIELFGIPNKWNHQAELLTTGVDGRGELILEYDRFNVTIVHSKIDNRGSYLKINGDHYLIVEQFSKMRGFFYNGEYLSVAQKSSDMCYELEEFYSLIKERKLSSSYNSWEKTLAVMEILEDARKQAGIIFA
ncbi:MAG: Gfo/Idh/MocA family protein [Brevinema sp.]